ncbi:MAG: hypothetical protein NTY41_01085 [Proteobacteria bacterium]|nr:hypothetical protein [Pseudomonadota bacterium]
MAIDSSTSGLQSVNQLGWQQLKLQQAKRSADQAEQTALSLQQQASAAKRVADRAQENARSLGVQSDQAQTIAARARQGLAALSTGASMQSQLTYVVDQVVNRQQTTQANAQTQDRSSAAKTTGQSSTNGTIINTTA